MNELQFRVAMFVLAVIAVIAFLIMTAGLMAAHPAVPWFGFGVVATLFLEVFGYGFYKVYQWYRRIRRWGP